MTIWKNKYISKEFQQWTLSTNFYSAALYQIKREKQGEREHESKFRVNNYSKVYNILDDLVDRFPLKDISTVSLKAICSAV